MAEGTAQFHGPGYPRFPPGLELKVPCGGSPWAGAKASVTLEADAEGRSLVGW